MRYLDFIARIVVLAAIALPWLQLSSTPDDCRGGDPSCPTGFDPFVAARLQQEPIPPIESVPTPLLVEYGGCETVLTTAEDGVECIYDPDRELRLWIVHPDLDRVEVRVDGEPFAGPTYSRAEEPGRGMMVALARDDAQRLTVVAPDEDPWRLPLRAMTRLTRDEQQRRATDDQQAFELEKALTLGQQDAEPELRRLIDGLQAQGLLGDAVRAALVGAYHLSQAPGRPDRALEVLAALPSLSEYPWGHAAASIYRGNALFEQGRLIEAAQAYRVGARYAIRMDDVGLRIDALSMYSRILAELGYFDAARHWGQALEVLVTEHGRLPDRVDALTTLGWTNLRLREVGDPHDDPTPSLREALALGAAAADDEDTGELDPARLGLAKLALLDGDPALALDRLDGVSLRPLTPAQIVEAHDIRLRALILARGTEGRTVIRAALAALREAARRAASPAAQWQASVRQGTVLELEGDGSGARAAYERAERQLDQLLPLILLGVGGGPGPASYDEGTLRLFSLLLAQGRPHQALCVIRQARARAGVVALSLGRLDATTRARLRPQIEGYLQLRSQREQVLRWSARLSGEGHEQALREAERQQVQLGQLAYELLTTRGDEPGRPTCEQLRPREPGELVLVLVPRRNDLLVLAQDDVDTSFRTISDYETLLERPGASSSTSWLLGPLDDRLLRARRVRVLASGWAARVDVHAHEWRGRPLALQLPVVYGLDLPARPSQTEGTTPPRALLFADIRAARAREEADGVEHELTASGWAVDRSDPGIDSVSALMQAMERTSLFHYAGHAYYDQRSRNDASLRVWPPYPGGAASEPSYIPVGEDAVGLQVQDVLMMDHAPRTVVLMGCATGVHDDRMAYGGMSLAAAFLGARAQAVIATTERVAGADAATLSEGLYTGFSLRDVNDPGSWMMHALRRAVEHGLSDDALRSYRVLVP